MLSWLRPRVARERLAAVLFLALGPALLALVAGGCASGTAPRPAAAPVPSGPPPADAPYVVDPRQGWDGVMSPEQTARLGDGYAAIAAGDAAAARSAATAANGGEPPAAGAAPYPPAAVLAAEADVLDQRAGDAVARLEPLAEQHPAYVALQLVLGRAAESAGDLVTAFAAFRRVADRELLAYDRAEELRPRVAEVLKNRVDDALTRGALPAAEETLARLRRWLPEETVTVVAGLDVATARGDRRGELEALRELVPRAAADTDLDATALRRRQADLELDVGDSKVGLDLYERLAAAHPGDAELAERVAFAKFRWRVDQMPPAVRQVAASPQLQRGDLAVLLYWLVPRVRSTRGSTARIASDILDDPRREEIARVLNLGLMDMDVSVHRFYPERPVRREVALRAVLRVLDRLGGAACAAPAAQQPQPPLETTCSAAFDCGLLRGEESCVPQGDLSGGEAVALIRRALATMAALAAAG